MSCHHPQRYRIRAILVWLTCCGVFGSTQHSKIARCQTAQNQAETVALLSSEARLHGDALRGIAIYATPKSACVSCHRIGQVGGTIGPDLTNIGTQRTTSQLTESLLYPNALVNPEFQIHQVLTEDGEVVRGYKIGEDAKAVVLRDPANGIERTISLDSIDDRRLSLSLMPEGLCNQWPKQQQLDLIAFLTDLGNSTKLRPELIAEILSHAAPHEPAKFPYQREPIDKSIWPNWQAHVNRDRIYDFYAKQADYFRVHEPNENFLMEFPGLDGGMPLGHWGNQNEETWASNWWNDAALGSVQAGVFHGPDRLVVPRAVCIHLGQNGELAACFDPDRLAYSALWRGGFVKFSTVRHGFLHGLVPIGELLDPPAHEPLVQPVRYRGYYRIGPRIVFSYIKGGVEYLDAPWVTEGRFVREVASRDRHSLRDQLTNAPRQWPQTMRTEIKLGSQSPYAIDTIELPQQNPWRTPMFCGDHDFLPDGSAMVVTMQGDVWRVTGLESQQSSTDQPTATWTRFASGLHHALGIRILNSGIFVLGRDQLTRLHDLNLDGEADFYEAYSIAFETSPAGHDFICGLQTDQAGNFYTASGNQGVVRIATDGQSSQVIANGFRNPDGLGIYPDGMVTVPCSEGDWTPASMICAIPAGDRAQIPFFGYRSRQFVNQPVSRPELPLVYLPRGVDNSAGGQVYIDSQRWGPLQGQMVHFSFGTGSHFLLLRDVVDDQIQGAVIPLPGEFQSGVHRGRFSPTDGQLYVSGMAGWGAYTVDVGCFQRVRYTGARVQIPIGFHLHQNGIAVKFPEPLDSGFVGNSTEHFAQAWNYRYGPAYGSAEYSTRKYGAVGHDRLRVASSRLFDDGHTLFLEIPDLVPCNQLHLRLAVGRDKRIDMFATCHKLDRPRLDFEGALPVAQHDARHPLDVDMELAAKRIKNPWANPIEGSRRIHIEAGKNLTFLPRVLNAQPGEAIALTLSNPDTVPHNWALIMPGKLSAIGEQANRLVAAPEGYIQQYVPLSSDVICYTDIVEPHQEFTIHFRAPNTPGRYPFLCTFPGHWMVMNGELIVDR